MDRTLFAGAAKRDITIADVGPDRLLDPLFVRTLVLDDGVQRFAVLALDAVAIGGISDIPDDFLAKFRAAAETRFGIPAAHLLVSATHTHPANDKALHCPPDELLRRCLDSIAAALETRVPVVAAAARTEEKRFTMNRTLRLKDGSHWSVRHANPAPPDDMVAELGPLDPSVGVLKFDRADNGATVAVLFNFACHPLWGDPANRISANYPGVACGVIEDLLPGATAIFLQGAAGDVIDRGFKEFGQDRSRYILHMGTQLGLTVLRALRPLVSAPAALDFATRTVRLPRRLDIAEKIRELKAEERTLVDRLRGCPLDFQVFLPLYLACQLRGEWPLAHRDQYLAEERANSDALREMDKVNRANLRKYLDNLAIMEKLARLADRKATFAFHQALNAGKTEVEAEVSALRIGEFVLLTTPTEMLTEVALGIKAASPFPLTFILGCCNGYLHYGAPESDYPRDGYEVTECMLSPGWRAIHDRAAHAVLRELSER